MQLPWHLRDYIFAAAMTVGMLVSALFVAPIAPRFLELIVWAPVGGIFLTLGMARLQYRGSVALMIVPLGLILAFLSPLIGGYLALTAVITEVILFLRGNYRSKNHRCLGNVVFFTVALAMGYGTASLVVGEEFAILLNQPLRFVGLILAAGMTGALGWWLGEITLSQLKRMGYWKPET